MYQSQKLSFSDDFLSYIGELFQISTEIEKMPQGRFLPQPVGHDLPLEIEVANFQPSSSSDWLAKHGLKGDFLFASAFVRNLMLTEIKCLTLY